MSPAAKTRKTRISKSEILKILADRAKHPEMGTTEWCAQYPVSYANFYYWNKKFGKELNQKKNSEATAVANKATPVLSAPVAELLHALKEAKHWQAESDRLCAALTPEQIREALAQFL